MAAWRRWLLRRQIGLLALVIPDLSKWVPLPLLLRALTPRAPSRWFHAFTQDEIIAAIERRLRAPWRMRGRPCLRRGLLTFRFLRPAGIPAVLQFGLLRGGPRDHAHCWVTVAGRCVTPPPEQAYVLIWVHGDDSPRQGAPAPALARAS